MPSTINPEIFDIDHSREETDIDKVPSADGRPGDVISPTEDLSVALAEMKDRWMRSEAEIANLRARAKRDLEEARQFAMQRFASEVVEAAENLTRGLYSLPPEASGEPDSMAGLRTGLSEIERGFMGLLERNGIKAADPTGAIFNSHLYEAIGQRETSESAPGTVLQTFTPVWTLNGRLLRAARVVVAKAPSLSSEGSTPTDDADIR